MVYKVDKEILKKLRQETGAGILHCDQALQETKGDLEAAKDWLRKKGQASASAKSDRHANEGLVALYKINGTTAHIIELNCETDFVAQNEKFKELAENITKSLLPPSSIMGDISKFVVDVAKNLTGMPEGSPQVTNLTELEGFHEQTLAISAVMGEKIELTRAAILNASVNGLIEVYVHDSKPDFANVGKIGVAVCLESTDNTKIADSEEYKQLAKNLCLHITSARPLALSLGEIDPQIMSKEREIAELQASESKKSTEIQNRMVEGKLLTFYTANVLEEQEYFFQEGKKVKEVLPANVKIAYYVRWQRGELA